MTPAPAQRAFLDESADLDQRIEYRGLRGMDASWRSGVELAKQPLADAVHA